MGEDRNPEQNVRLAADLHAMVASTAEAWANAVEAGHGREIVNPFTNETTRLPIAEEAAALHKQLAERGLLGDAAAMKAVRDALSAVAHQAVFGVLCAIDGAGEFPSGLSVGLSVDDEPLEPFLHEVYFPASRG